MEGVHQHRTRSPEWERQQRGDPAEGAGLGGVGVDEVGAVAAQQPNQSNDRGQVAESWLSSKARDAGG